MDNRLKNIDLLLLDVDGVLTKGEVVYTDSGEQIKTFSSRDGLGLRLLMDAGIKVGLITGRTSKALTHRCANLGISLLYDGIQDKARAFDRITGELNIPKERTAFAGDDLIDLPAMTRAGIAFAVADAATEVKTAADIVTLSNGGCGAVREICEQILKAKGLWESILASYLT